MVDFSKLNGSKMEVGLGDVDAPEVAPAPAAIETIQLDSEINFSKKGGFKGSQKRLMPSSNKGNQLAEIVKRSQVTQPRAKPVTSTSFRSPAPQAAPLLGSVAVHKLNGQQAANLQVAALSVHQQLASVLNTILANPRIGQKGREFIADAVNTLGRISSIVEVVEAGKMEVDDGSLDALMKGEELVSKAHTML